MSRMTVTAPALIVLIGLTNLIYQEGHNPGNCRAELRLESYGSAGKGKGSML